MFFSRKVMNTSYIIKTAAKAVKRDNLQKNKLVGMAATAPKKKAAAIKDQMNHPLPTAARMRKAQKFLIAAEVNIQLIL